MENNEYIIQLSDIENELKKHTKKFKDKIIYLNCDNPNESMFWLYFENNFKKFGLRKLISTYKGNSPYKTEYDGNYIKKTLLKENGDFRSQETIEILKVSDIIITKPPVLLFNDFVDILFKYNKKFIILGYIKEVDLSDESENDMKWTKNIE